MNDQWRKTFLLWAKTPEYLDLVTETRIKIYDVTREKRCYVAFSGGKDSTVMLHLTLQCQSDIHVYHWDYGIFMPREVEAEIQANMQTFRPENITVETRVSQESSAFFGAVNQFMREKKLEVALVGLRKEESLRRRRKMRKQPKGEFYPLANWGWKDVWAYIISNNLPYPKLYDVYGPILGWDKARFVTFFDPEFNHLGAANLDGFFFPEYRNQPQY